MSAAQPARPKGQAGGFEQRMAKGPDASRGFKGAGRGAGGFGGGGPPPLEAKYPTGAPGVAHVSPQISFAQMAMGNKAQPQFADAPQAGMIPALMLTATDPKASARAAASAAAGISVQKQAARAQAAEQAKLQQKRLEAAAEAEAAQQAQQRAQQAAIQEESNRRQRLLEAAKEDALNRQMQLERAARAQVAGATAQYTALSAQSAMPAPLGLQGRSASEPLQHHTVVAPLQHNAGAQSAAAKLPGAGNAQQQQGQQANAAAAAPQPAASSAARAIDGQAWPAIKPREAPGATAPTPLQNVWGAKPSSILTAPAPVEEKKPTAQQQKALKVETAPQQKNAWGKVAVGRYAEVKPGTPKASTPTLPSPHIADSKGTQSDAKTSEHSEAETYWEGQAAEPDWQNNEDFFEGGDAEKERAQKMVEDFLRQRGMPQMRQDVDEAHAWTSDNVHKVMEDSADTDEVFVMRPNGVSLAAPQSCKDDHPALSWETQHQQPAPVQPSAWARGAPRISDEGSFGDAFAQGSYGQGFGLVDYSQGLNDFEFSCDDGDMFSNTSGFTSAWGNPNPSVRVKEDSDKDKNAEEVDKGEKSPSVALKMMLGIGLGDASLPYAPSAVPPVARKLPVWGKPDGKIDISLDPAIAQIAKDFPPGLSSAKQSMNIVHEQGNGRVSSQETAHSVEFTWESKQSQKDPMPNQQDLSSEPEVNAAPLQQSMPLHMAGLSLHMSQMPAPHSMMQKGPPQLQGPAAFMQSAIRPLHEQMGAMGGGSSMTSERPPDSVFPFGLGGMGGPGGGGMGLMSNAAPRPGDNMPSERPSDSIFSFGMGGVTGGGPVGGMHMMHSSGTRPSDNQHLPLWMQQQHQIPPMGMGNISAIGMGNMGMPNAGPRPGDLPPWMQQMQVPPMGMGNMGMLHNSGPRPPDTSSLPPWMQHQQQGPMASGGMSGGGPLQGVGMGMMSGMGSGFDMLQMIGGPSRQDLPGNNFNNFQEHHSTSDMLPHMDSDVGGQGRNQPPGGGSSSFNFAAFSQNGTCQPGNVQVGGGGGDGSGVGGGSFDFNKVFGGLGSGPANMSKMPQLGAEMPSGTMLSLAEIEGRMVD